MSLRPVFTETSSYDTIFTSVGLFLEKKKHMNILYESYPFIEGCLKFGICYVKRKIKFVYNLFWRDVL